MGKPYAKLPRERQALLKLGLRATDPRNPHPTSLNARISMVGNVGRNTQPEVALRQALRAAGVRGYRLNRRIEGVRPDLVLGPSRVAVFVHGCFWHRCPICRHPLPRSHKEFWLAKFRRNRQRDREKRRVLENAGWRVVEVWEHEIRDDLPRTALGIRRLVIRGLAIRQPAIRRPARRRVPRG